MRGLYCFAVLAAASAAPLSPFEARFRARSGRGSSSAGRARPSSVSTRVSAPTNPDVVSVLDFGADPSGAKDSTSAFQAALSSLATTGGEVIVPSGNFSFSGSLTFPPSVALSGTFLSVPSHDVAQGEKIPNAGSILLITGGRGNSSGTPFMTLTEDCAVRGLVFYYPQNIRGVVPAPYPFTISLTGNNPAVEDVELLNCWNGINAVGAARHYIARVQGQPANIGISIDQTYDIGRLEDVHWNPWWDASPAYVSWQINHGVGFLIARTDWEYVLNTFVFGMSVGYQFVQSDSGSCNGNFVGIGADCCTNASVVVESSDPWGILIANGEFTSFTFGKDNGADHAQIVVLPSNAGAVRFTNTAFWGPSHEVARVAGTGSVGFDSCIMNAWDAAKTGAPAIHVTGGDILVRGCDFQTAHSGGQVVLDVGTRKAIVTENLMAGAELVANNGAKLAIVKDNAPDTA